MRWRPALLVELGLVEQRLAAVLEMLNDGAQVIDVAKRYDVPPPSDGAPARAEGPGPGDPATPADRDLGVGDPQGRHLRQRLLRRSCYRVGNAFKRRQVQVAIVGDTVEISIGERRTREHDALANPGGRPRRTKAA